MDWLTHLSDADAAALLALARTQAGPLSAEEARLILAFAVEGVALGYGLQAIRWALRTPAELTQIIGRPLMPGIPSAHGSRALGGALGEAHA